MPRDRIPSVSLDGHHAQESRAWERGGARWSDDLDPLGAAGCPIRRAMDRSMHSPAEDMPTTRLRGTTVTMVGFVHYPHDNRVRREAEALTRAGARVDGISLRRAGQPARDQVDGVHVHRLGVNRQRGGRLRHFVEYGLFAGGTIVALATLGRQRRPDVVHVHNPPDLLAHCAWGARRAGAR